MQQLSSDLEKNNQLARTGQKGIDSLCHRFRSFDHDLEQLLSEYNTMYSRVQELDVNLKAANARVQIANEELAKLRVNFDHSKSECQALKAERDKLVQDNSTVKAQVTAWFWGCAESAVSHNWQLEEKITLENIRKEEVYAHDHSSFTLVTSAADKQADAVGNCSF